MPWHSRGIDLTGGMVQVPVSIDRSLATPLQDQLAIELRKLIVQQTLRSGMRLPATRALSLQLNVSRNTVKTAYANLVSQGYLQSRSTSGTYVCTALPDKSIEVNHNHSQVPIDTERLTNQPDSQPANYTDNEQRRLFSAEQHKQHFDFRLQATETGISPVRTWRRLLLKHLPYRSCHAATTEVAGLQALRIAIADSISPLRGMSVVAQNSLIISDDYRAFDLINKTLQHDTRRVCVEDPCDAGLVYLLHASGFELCPIPVDEEGLCVEQLPTDNVQLVYVSPSHQKPGGATLSMARREALLNWVEHTGAHIVEWDTYGEFCYDGSPLPSLYSMDQANRVIYINSFSTWMGDETTLGYLVYPPDLLDRALAIRTFVDPIQSWIGQQVTADFINSDSFFDHLRRVRQIYKNRRDALLSAMNEHFEEPHLTGSHAGQHLVWRLPNQFGDSREITEKLAAKQIKVQPLYEGFCCFGKSQHWISTNRTLLLNYTAQSEESLYASVAAAAQILGVKRFGKIRK